MDHNQFERRAQKIADDFFRTVDLGVKEAITQIGELHDSAAGSEGGLPALPQRSEAVRQAKLKVQSTEKVAADGAKRISDFMSKVLAGS